MSAPARENAPLAGAFDDVMRVGEFAMAMYVSRVSDAKSPRHRVRVPLAMATRDAPPCVKKLTVAANGHACDRTVIGRVNRASSHPGRARQIERTGDRLSGH